MSELSPEQVKGVAEQAVAADEVCAGESPQPSPLNRVFYGRQVLG